MHFPDDMTDSRSQSPTIDASKTLTELVPQNTTVSEEREVPSAVEVKAANDQLGQPPGAYSRTRMGIRKSSRLKDRGSIAEVEKLNALMFYDPTEWFGEKHHKKGKKVSVGDKILSLAIQN